MVVYRNPRFGRASQPQSQTDSKHRWLSVVSNPVLVSSALANHVKEAAEVAISKIDEEFPVEPAPQSEEPVKVEEPKPAKQPTAPETKVPFDLLTGTFWNSSWATTAEIKNALKSEVLTDAIKESARSHFAQLRYWLLVMALGGTCWFLAVLLVDLLTQKEHDNGLRSASLVSAETHAPLLQASNQ